MIGDEDMGQRTQSDFVASLRAASAEIGRGWRHARGPKTNASTARIRLWRSAETLFLAFETEL
jgi:hypothetical protein